MNHSGLSGNYDLAVEHKDGQIIKMLNSNFISDQYAGFFYPVLTNF